MLYSTYKRVLVLFDQTVHQKEQIDKVGLIKNNIMHFMAVGPSRMPRGGRGGGAGERQTDRHTG